MFRLALTRYWCWGHRFGLHQAGYYPLEVAAVLADDDGPLHPLWPAFAGAQRLPDLGAAPARSGWVAVGPPEPVGPDLEVVQLVPAETVAMDRRCPPLTLLVRLTRSGWQIAGHGRVPIKVGWPPAQ
jgi:hypothetical protein